MGYVLDFPEHDPPSDTDGLFTIKDVAAACGISQPVIAQQIARTWTNDG